MEIMMSRRHAVGLAVGALWLVAVCAAFMTWALVMMGTTAATVTLVAMVALVVALIGVGVWMIRAVLHLPGQIPAKTPTERRMGRQFAWVVAAEIVAVLVVNAILGITNRVILIPAFDLMIVGLHFLPLAHLFRVPRYYSMGALFIVIPVLTLLVVSEPILIGNVQAWYVLPSVGCGVVGVVTAAASFWEVRGFLRAAISPAVEPA
jgi:hypothetical protein